jgi:RNA recognition motif-containing protein
MSSAVDNLADNLASASVQDPSGSANDTVLASAAEGRRLYIGNLAYATTEGELKDFFSAYKVYVKSSHAQMSPLSLSTMISQLF